MKIPFLSLEPVHAPIKGEVLKAFEEVYDSNWFILGERVRQFELNYAKFINVKHCVGVSNGTDALHISLRTLGIGVGDEVILPSNTFIATVLAVSHVGATPVFVEPDIKTYNIDVTKIEPAITSKTRCIMPVHLYGQACEMQQIMAIAKNHNLWVIEDNAQAQGATYQGQPTGSFGNINATSFYPGKALGALGDAGAITTNDGQLADKARTLANYGSDRKYYNSVLGFNMRLDECQAAVLNVKLQYLRAWIRRRKEIANLYAYHLGKLQGVILPHTAASATHTYHLYVIRAERRDTLAEHLARHGIGTSIHYPIPPHLQESYRHLGFKKGNFPLAETIADTCLSLPIWPGMTEKQIAYVAKQIAVF
jgi:dTDP-4-amino-4,6-dideoxygalactose transaminase